MKSVLLLLLALFATSCLIAQENELVLISLLEDDSEEMTDYTTASFKTNKVINLHSLESPAAGVLDFKISHRFNTVKNGFYDIFGLDGATIRLGWDYGITDRLTAGIGRSTYEKTYDGYIKWKIARQSKGKKKFPLTIAALSAMSVNTLRLQQPERQNYATSRLFYTHQLILGRKFSEGFSLQLSPTLVHRNLVRYRYESNDVYALGIAGRIKLSKRVALTVEYIYVLPDQLASEYTNSLSIGFDIETGGHVFQLHFTNSSPMIEKGFITETKGEWLNSDIHFGFNISRVFTLKKRK